MKKTFTKLNLFIASLLLVFASLTAGFADWVYSQATITKTVEAIDDKEEPVAYIDTDETKLYTIEDALSKATALSNNGNTAVTVYVKPWMNGVCTTATIKKDCEITKNVSLVLPYEGTDSMSRDTTSGSFADRDANAVKTNRASNISIADGITLTNNGTLTIGGQLGGQGSPSINGQTAGKYSQITMNSSSKIISNGTLNVYGYIKNSGQNIEDAYVDIRNAGIVYAPMVIYDFKGGSYTALKMLGLSYATLALSSTIDAKEGVFPVSEFDFPNIQCWAKINTGANYTGLAELYANSDHNLMECKLIGSGSGLFSLTSGYIMMRRVASSWSSEESYTYDDKKQHTMQIKVSGECSLDSLSLSITIVIEQISMTRTVKINSANFFVPFSYKIDVEICSGSTFNMGNKAKFKTGSRLMIDNGATMNVNAALSFYSQFADANSINQRYPSFNAAECIVNGNFNLNSSFGGNISTSQEGSVLFTGSSFSNGVSTEEMNGDNQSSHSETALAVVSYNGATPSNKTLIASTTYSGKQDSKYYFAATVELSVSPSASDSRSNTASTGTISLLPGLWPDESLFDSATFKWEITDMSCDRSGKKSGIDSNTISNASSATAIFNVVKIPEDYKAFFVSSKTTWTYTIKFTASFASGSSYSGSIKIEVTSQ